MEFTKTPVKRTEIASSALVLLVFWALGLVIIGDGSLEYAVGMLLANLLALTAVVRRWSIKKCGVTVLSCCVCTFGTAMLLTRGAAGEDTAINAALSASLVGGLTFMPMMVVATVVLLIIRRMRLRFFASD